MLHGNETAVTLARGSWLPARPFFTCPHAGNISTFQRASSQLCFLDGCSYHF